MHVGDVAAHAAHEVASAFAVEESYGEDGHLVVDVVAQAFDETVAYVAQEELRHETEEIAQQRAAEIAGGHDEQAFPCAEGGLVLIEVPESPVHQLFLVESKLGLGVAHSVEAEHQLHERNDEHVGAQVEEDVQQIEEDIHRDLHGEIFEVGHDAAHGLHSRRI